MTFHNQVRRRLPLLLLPALLCLPRAAFAQFDDPGLAPPPPPPSSPAPAKEQPRQPAVSSPAAAPVKTAPRVTPPTATVTLVPAPAPAAAPSASGTKEEITEETVILPASAASADDWEARRAAPALSGQIGLLRTQAADVGLPLNFRVGTHLQLFSLDSFLVKPPKGSTGPGDNDQRFLGDLTIALTGPDITFLRNLEIYLGIFNGSNQNKRTETPSTARTDPTVILALADVGFGIKGAWKIGKAFALGLNVGTRFFNSISAVSANYDATNVNVDALATLDVRKLAPSVPMVFHLNVGYLVDNSLKLLPPQCPTSNTNDPCIRSRVVETFAYGLNVSRVRSAIALALPFRPRVGNSYFGIELFGEYHLDIATGDGDLTVARALTGMISTDFPKERITNPLSQYVTVGARLRPFARLMIDLGADFAIQSPGFQYGPPIPTWNVILGASYAYDALGPQNKLTTRTIIRTTEVSKKVPVGKISGMVRDAKTKKPIAGAVVKYQSGSLSAQMTGADGGFVSYDLAPGPVQMQISATDYEPATASGTIEADSVKPIDVVLKPMPPREGKVRIRVTDDKVNPLLGATARLTGLTAKDAVLEGELLVATVPPGDYTVSVDAANFLSKDKQITVKANGDETVEFSLNKRPKISHVEVTKDQIVIKGTIHFATNEARLLPDGQQILNEVVDVLAKSPQIKKVSVEGHTDNSGDKQKNQKLSTDRAAAVVDYMSKNGIASDRLSSQGFGQDKPLVPNVTPADRAKNRRVEFRITDQTAGTAR